MWSKKELIDKQAVVPIPYRSVTGRTSQLDAAVQDRIIRLLAPEPLQAAALGDPLRLDNVDGREL
jgi:hypothetical protein